MKALIKSPGGGAYLILDLQEGGSIKKGLNREGVNRGFTVMFQHPILNDSF